MKFHVEDRFLTRGSCHPPTPPHDSDFVAVAIASSSEVDIADYHGYRMSPKGLVPYSKGLQISAVRKPYANPLEGVLVAADNVGFVGEKLILQLYEPGDALVAPGPRAPYLTGGVVINAPTTAATAQLACRLPFSGRQQGTFWLFGNAGTDINVVFRGVRYGVNNVPSLAFGAEESAADDLWAGAGATPVTQVLASGLAMSRSFNLGGAGDSQLPFDEIQAYVWASVAAQTIVFSAEVFGERGG